MFWPLVHEAQRRSTAATRMRRTPITREAMAAARFLASTAVQKAAISASQIQPRPDDAVARPLRRLWQPSHPPHPAVPDHVVLTDVQDHANGHGAGRADPFPPLHLFPPIWLARRVAGRPPFLPGKPAAIEDRRARR